MIEILTNREPVFAKENSIIILFIGEEIFPFIKPYKFHVVWNVVYNILYALFSTLSFIALIPMMQVLFAQAEKISQKPTYNSIWELPSFAKQYLYYYITELN